MFSIAILLFSIVITMRKYSLLFLFALMAVSEGLPFYGQNNGSGEVETQKPFLSKAPSAHSEWIVDLRNPKYENGMLYTEEGGVIQAKEIRIQAKTIRYIRRGPDGKEEHRVEAKGDLMIQYKGRAFTGESLEFDFLSEQGTIVKGKTFSSPWYIGGERIELRENGNYLVKNASITTGESKQENWGLKAKTIEVIDKSLLKAKNLSFYLFNIPTFWLPYFKLNLKKFPESVVRYQASWDKGNGPKISLRYQMYSWKEFAWFLRGEWRMKRGFGGALETEYFPSHKRSSFVTRNYLATDLLDNDPVIKRRYRVQGEGRWASKNGKTKGNIAWDKYSDIEMPSDFASDDFELNPAKITHLYGRHQEKDLIGILYVRPRVNSFESVKQNLPMVFGTVRPLRLGSSGIVSENWCKAAYLDFVYSNDLTRSLPDFHSFRLETQNKIYRPFLWGPTSFTPYLGVIGIYYSRSPQQHSAGQGIISYGGTFKTSLHRNFSTFRHIIEPYLSFQGLTDPVLNNTEHFIFSIQDGYHRINLIRFGIRNLFFWRKKERPSHFTGNLWANGFFGDPTQAQFIPKIYLNLHWDFPSFEILNTNGWNFRHQTVDFANLRLLWTVNEDLAMSIEGRYRSKYDWRKADRENFILDVTRPEEELLQSPISDQRVTLLTHIFFQITPFWSCQFQSHHGWDRPSEPPYNEFKVDLFTKILQSWKVRLTYQHTQKDDRFTGGIQLIKK
jgi:hypothetical protein